MLQRVNRGDKKREESWLSRVITRQNEERYRRDFKLAGYLVIKF